MGKAWLSACVWFLIWAGVFALTRRWGMYWFFGASACMASCAWLLLLRTCALLFLPRPVMRYVPPPQRRVVRRVILEEEEVL